MRKILILVVAFSVLVVLATVSMSDLPKKPDAPSAATPKQPDTGNGGQERWKYMTDRLDKADARADSLQAQVLNAQHDAETAWIMVFRLADRIKKLADKIERVEI